MNTEVTPVKPPKMALCIHREDAPGTEFHTGTDPVVRPIPWTEQEWHGLPILLQDRASCESDLRYLQLLPYTVLIDSAGNIFTYRRGSLGDENKLHAKFSVGVGGHVDTLPPVGTDLVSHLRAEQVREMQEEVGISPDFSKFTPFEYIADTSDEVGNYHIGLLSFYTMDKHDTIMPEAGTIESGMFASLDYLASEEVFPRLEGWSKAVVNTLLEGRANQDNPE